MLQNAVQYGGNERKVRGRIAVSRVRREIFTDILEAAGQATCELLLKI